MRTVNLGVVMLALVGCLHLHCDGGESGESAPQGLPDGEAGSVAGVGDLDTDGSGTVSVEEWSALGGNQETYDVCDANQDGMLSNNEVQTCSLLNPDDTGPSVGAEGCEPGAIVCDGADLLECITDGSKYDRIDECIGAFYCDASVGACVCVPACEGKTCGDNGCGGTCGSCDTPQTACSAGVCVCEPACDGKTCGDDGCGSVCGACAEGEECAEDGSCVVPGVCDAPEGGTGVNVGDISKNVPWQGSDGSQVNLHDFCGEKQVIVMIETAAW